MKNQGDRLKELIARFVLKYNYWGYLFSRIRRKPMSYEQLTSVMGVGPEKDGTLTLFYAPELMEKTADKEILRVIEHEGMHVLNKHIPRYIRILANETAEQRKNIKTKVWNIASDCTVNCQANIRTPIIIDGKPWAPCLPAKYNLEEGQVTEFYFYELLKTANVVTMSVPGEGGNGEGNDGFNGHQQWKNGVNGVADLSSLSRKIDQHVQNIIKDSVKNFNKERGNMPAHIAQLIEGALAPPKAPYYQIIRKLVRGSRFSKFKRSPTKINRKRTYVFTIQGDSCVPEISPFPGKTRDMTFDIVVMIDTSGSMSDEDVKEGLSGVKNIIEKDRHCYTTVLEVDAGVEKEYEVKKIRDIQFNIKGRGGTTLRPGLERARQLGCDVCLAFTDGYTEDINSIPRKYLPKKLIWVITPDGTARNVNKTGYVVHI
jgi:predicted metal-dependent peptidase